MTKNCLIIGASGEIGEKTAERLADEGYTLLLHYNHNCDGLNRLVQKLPNEAVLQVIQGDLSRTEGIKSFIKKIHFQVDAIVFASGKSLYQLFHETDELEMNEMLNVHVKALWMISKSFIPQMIDRKQGNIIVISSIWGEVGASCEVVYSSVKGAQNSFIKSLGKELAASGVNVNGVSPGYIETKMNNAFSSSEKQLILEQIPANRAGQPDEVAHAVAFLLDDRSSYIQGEIIRVTGAW